MKTLDELVAATNKREVRLQVNVSELTTVTEVTVEGLFHVPLLALTILIVVRSRKNGLSTIDLSSWITAVLSKHFDELRISRSRLHWSVILRRRCAEALVFLEGASLVIVKDIPNRIVLTTVPGMEFVQRAKARPDEIGVLVRQLSRAYRAIDQTGLYLL